MMKSVLPPPKVAISARVLHRTRGNVLLINNPSFRVGDTVRVNENQNEYTVVEVRENTIRNAFVICINARIDVDSRYEINLVKTKESASYDNHDRTRNKLLFNKRIEEEREKKERLVNQEVFRKRQEKRKKLALEKEKLLNKIEEEYQKRPEIIQAKRLSEYYGQEVQYDFNKKKYQLASTKEIVSEKNYEESDLVPNMFD